MKFIIASFALFILLYQDCGSCEPDGDCLQSFHFQVPMSLSPQIDTIHIGDTFCLKSNIPDFLRDTFSGLDLDVSQFEFDIVNDIGRHVDTGYVSAEQEFVLVNKTGTYQIIPIAANVIRSLVLYEKIENERVFECCFVAKQTGLYQLVFSHLQYKGRSIVHPDCVELISIDVKMNDGVSANNNYEILQSSPQAIATDEVFRRGGGYAFLVVE